MKKQIITLVMIVAFSATVRAEIEGREVLNLMAEGKAIKESNRVAHDKVHSCMAVLSADGQSVSFITSGATKPVSLVLEKNGYFLSPAYSYVLKEDKLYRSIKVIPSSSGKSQFEIITAKNATLKVTFAIDKNGKDQVEWNILK